MLSNSVTRATPSHFGIYVTELERMVDFYSTVFGLTITDKGRGHTFKSDLVFMSASPDQHHQLVLVSGRPKEATFSTVMQISFMVPSIQFLRDIKATALSPAEPLVTLHANLVSQLLTGASLPVPPAWASPAALPALGNW